MSAFDQSGHTHPTLPTAIGKRDGLPAVRFHQIRAEAGPGLVWQFVVFSQQSRNDWRCPLLKGVIEGITSLTAQGLPPVPQAVVQPLTRAAIFLVGTINANDESVHVVRSFCGDLPALLRSVGFRDVDGNLSCVMGIGSVAWDRLFGQPRPAELHPFREIKADSRHAVA